VPAKERVKEPTRDLFRCHCEGRSDEAIQRVVRIITGLLRSARNDMYGKPPCARRMLDSRVKQPIRLVAVAMESALNRPSGLMTPTA